MSMDCTSSAFPKSRSRISCSAVAGVLQAFQILGTSRMFIGRSVDWRPHRLANKQSHRFYVILLVKSESVVDAGRQNQEVALGNFNPYPLVVAVSNVKVTTPSQDKANFFIRVQMLLEECFYLFFIVQELFSGYLDDISVRISSLLADFVQFSVLFICVGIQFPVEDSALGANFF